MINKNWVRWIFTTLAKHFDEKKNNITLYIEGRDLIPDILDDHAELRINGPFYSILGKNTYELILDIHILIFCNIDELDNYKLQRFIGILSSAFEKEIKAFKFGSGGEDTQEYLGCLLLIDKPGGDVVVTNIGQIAPNIRALQSTIEASYKIQLEG